MTDQSEALEKMYQEALANQRSQQNQRTQGAQGAQENKQLVTQTTRAVRFNEPVTGGIMVENKETKEAATENQNANTPETKQEEEASETEEYKIVDARPCNGITRRRQRENTRNLRRNLRRRVGTEPESDAEVAL